MTTIRFLTIGEHVPRFSEHGLDIARAWRPIDVESLLPEARDMLELQIGRLVMIHEFDVDAFLASTGGLELFEGKLRYPVGTDLTTAPPIGRRHQASVAAADPVDGPTLEEYIAAGYPPDSYPPLGYDEVPSKGLTALRKTVAAPVRGLGSPTAPTPASKGAKKS